MCKQRYIRKLCIQKHGNFSANVNPLPSNSEIKLFPSYLSQLDIQRVPSWGKLSIDLWQKMSTLFYPRAVQLIPTWQRASEREVYALLPQDSDQTLSSKPPDPGDTLAGDKKGPGGSTTWLTTWKQEVTKSVDLTGATSNILRVFSKVNLKSILN